MSTSNQSAKSCLYYVGMTLLVMVILGTILPIFLAFVMPMIEQTRANQQAQLEQPFLSEMPSYTSVFRSAASHKILQGKILVIDPIEKKIDPLQYELPRKYQAKAPAEVNALVWFDCRVLESISYGGVNTFFVIDVETCKVTLIDWVTKSIVSQIEFTGKRPDDKFWASDADSVSVTLQKEARVNRETVIEWLLEQIQ